MGVKIGDEAEDNAIDAYGVDMIYNRYLMEQEDRAAALCEDREKLKKKLDEIEERKRNRQAIKKKDLIWGFKPLSIFEIAMRAKIERQK